LEILGSIQSEGVPVVDRDKMQRQLREFLLRVQGGQGWSSGNVIYKVHFWKPLFGTKVDALIEFRADGHDAWFARANGADAGKAFSRAMASLKQIVTELEMREESANVQDNDGAA
jgi:hypothetical protein